MTRLKPTRVKSSELGAKKVLNITVESYAILEGTSRDGKDWIEDVVFFTENGIPRYMKLNQQSIGYLAIHGVLPTAENLEKELPGTGLTFELITDSGPYPFYRLCKIAKKAKKVSKDNSASAKPK